MGGGILNDMEWIMYYLSTWWGKSNQLSFNIFHSLFISLRFSGQKQEQLLGNSLPITTGKWFCPTEMWSIKGHKWVYPTQLWLVTKSNSQAAQGALTHHLEHCTGQLRPPNKTKQKTEFLSIITMVLYLLFTKKVSVPFQGRESYLQNFDLW